MSDTDCSDVYDWPEDTPVGRKLASLEENLLCPICSGLFNNPHVLRCGHSYCSICIRKHFDSHLNRTSSDTCPSCREKADSFDLKKNGQLSNIVRAFRALRPNLLDLIKDANNVAEKERSELQNIKHGAAGVAITRKLPFYSFHGLKKDKVKSTLIQLTAESKAQIRLDGDKEILEKRVSAFLHLHNAQIGSDAPLSLDQVVKLVNYQETQMEKESHKGSRSAAKIEKVKNGEVVEDVENRFQDLAQKVREQKEAVLKKLTSANSAGSAESNGAIPSSCNTSSTAPHNESLGASSQPLQNYNPHCRVSNGVSVGAAESAQLMGFLEQRVDQGYDWGPWRVVLSRRLGRPFFYNSVTKIGQFAVPPELNVVPSPTQSQASQLDGMETYEHGVYSGDSSHCNTNLGCTNPYYMRNVPTSSGQSTTNAYLTNGTGLSATSAVNDTSGKENNNISGSNKVVPPRERVMHCDHYLGEEDEEESPFHMLWDSHGGGDHHVFDELDPSSFMLSEQPGQSNGAGDDSSCTATVIATATSAGGTSTAAGVTASDTPFHRGVAYSGASASTGASSVATAHLTHAGGPACPWEVVDVEAEGAINERPSMISVTHHSSQQRGRSQISTTAAVAAEPTQSTWACKACTYLNEMTTYTCDICGTVDVHVQQSFSRPLLRSGHLLGTPAVRSSQAAGPSQQQSRYTGSKLKPPASAAKPNKKAKK